MVWFGTEHHPEIIHIRGMEPPVVFRLIHLQLSMLQTTLKAAQKLRASRELPSGNLTWLLKMVIYSGFSQ